jgi:amino acid adenylation domain-containing protein
MAEHLLEMTAPESAGDLFVFPMSFAQQRLWILEELEPGSPAYNVPVARRLLGRLDLRALSAALARLITRHEILRTTFGTQDGMPVQVVHGAPRSPAPMPCTDLSGLPPAAREAEVMRRATEEAVRPFDLRRGPLLRASLLRLADDDHVFLLTLHHIITDGWSKGVLNRELAAFYAAEIDQSEPQVDPLPLQYADYAIWQREWLDGEELERQVAFWRETLAAPRTTLELPVDRPRPAIATSSGALHHFEIDADVADGARMLSRREGVTLFMTLLSGFQAMLHRYSGQDDIIVGSPIAGRTQAETEGMIGLFVNTLVLRTDLGGDPTFRTLLRRTRETALAAFAHEHLPFEKLVEVLQPERDRSRHPLFQVAFALQNVPGSGAAFVGLESRPVATPRETAKFDIMLTVAESGAGMRATMSYNTDLFDAATVERMAGHFRVLLAGAVADPDEPISRLPILTEPERRSILGEWNDTDAGYPAQETIHARFEAQVERAPGAIALIADGHSISYGDLNRCANQLAHRLRAAGVGPDRFVGICLERSAEMVVAILAVLKAGGAYVPLDPAYPADRLAFMLEDSAVSALVTTTGLERLLPPLACPIVRLDRDSAALAAEPGTNPSPSAAAGDLCYLIYTSGSTGRPKGVMIEHGNVVRLLVNDRFQFDFGPGDVWTIFHSFAFDFSVWEMYGALLYGGTAVVVPRAVAQSPADFLELLRRHGVTVLNQTPSAFYALASAELERPAADLRLRYVVFGGEALQPALLRAWRERYPGTALINMFGITETTVHVTYKEITEAEIASGASNIGRPIPTLTTYVLDRHLAPVPIGVAGELCVGGAGVARGYLRRDALTAERFVTHPYRPGERMYRSGDIGRLLPSGEIEYLGRRDDQVKIRGFRIELGEIEAALGQLPVLSQTVVIAREDRPGDKRLVAYVVMADGTHRPDTSALREHLRSRLPEHMVPAVFVELETLPLTSNGKVDRRALPVPTLDADDRAATYQVPRNPLEYQLAQIWESLLGVTPIGIRDNFFELGGHSLLAVRMAAEIEHACGRRVRLAYLFDAPTIELLARKLLADEAADHPHALIAVQPQGSRPPIFFLHGDIRGGGLYCYRMAQAVGPDQPLYALPPHRPDSPGAPASIEAMAAAHLDVIRSVRPRGPYRLGGFCNGALVAYEIARRLRALGESVEMLVLVDASAHGAALRYLEPLIDLVARRAGRDAGDRLDARIRLLGPFRTVEKRMRQLRQMSGARRRAGVRRYVTRRAREVGASLGIARPASSIPSPWGPLVVPEPEYLFVQRASRAYLPQPYDGPLHVVRAWTGEGEPLDPSRGWASLVPQVTAEVIRSSHLAIVTNELPAIMARIVAPLDAAASEPGA